MTDTVYLEDIESKPSAAAATVTEESTSSEPITTVTTSAVVENTGTIKRQRTLMDMFSGSQDSQKSAPATKKLKLNASGASASSRSSLKASGGSASFGLQKLNAIAFSLSAYQDAMTEEQQRLLKLECQVMGITWLKLLQDEIKKPYFLALKKFLWEEGVKGPDDSSPNLKIYPSPKNIYAWSRTPLGRVKVVMLGQDPYHGPRQAHGLCFSVPTGVAVPPSLRNIYIELKAEYPEFEIPKHGNLSAWASNGVLMLNSCLTVRAGQAGSHAKKGWEEFTDKVIQVVDKYGGANLPSDTEAVGLGRGVVFLAWGAWAAKRVENISKGKHLVLKSAHPSPLSVERGFRGNNHFKLANEWLEAKYGPQGKVNWCNLEE